MPYLPVAMEKLFDHSIRKLRRYSDQANYGRNNHALKGSGIVKRLINKVIIACRLQHTSSNAGQHKFTRGKSCTTCETDFLSLFSKAFNIGMSVIIIFKYNAGLD